jgi:hypothetical protein
MAASRSRWVVDLDRLARAERPHGALLQHAQQLHLQRGRHVPDLVEQQRAAVGLLEQALVVGVRVGEGAFHVAEQLGFEQRFGNGAAIDRDEGLVGAGAGAVDGARQQFLAGARVAAQQHRGVRLGDHARLGQQLRHAIAAAHDLGAPALVARAGGRAGGGAECERLGDLLEQLAAIVGLGEIGENAARGSLDRVGNGAVRGQQDHRQRGMALADLVEQLEPVAPGQAHVAEHQLRMLDLELRERGFGRGHGRDLVAGRTQPHRQQPQHVGVVVDHQQARAGRAHRGLAGGGRAGAAGVLGRAKLRSMARSASMRSLSWSMRRWLSRTCCTCFSRSSSIRRCST